MDAYKYVGVRVPVEVWRQVKQRSLDKGVSVQALALGLLVAEVGSTKPHADHQKPIKPTAKPNPLPEPKASGACQRCGHTLEQHWVKGCIAGCKCPRFTPV
jgi:hypothetical protein